MTYLWLVASSLVKVQVQTCVPWGVGRALLQVGAAPRATGWFLPAESALGCVCVCRAHSWWPGGTELGVYWCPSEAQLVPPVVPLP